jgi:nitrate reductase molybdenum cofactor assembly chaperone NarJ/NarW
MAKTFKALSALLTYPTDALQEAAEDLRRALDLESVVPPAIRNRLDGLIDELAGGDLYDLQERYVLLFDRTRSLSLHLFEHVHGESRDHGQAMTDLKSVYESGGLFVSSGELPDFLPLFLEYLSTRPLAEARELLGQTTHIIEALAERLRRRGSSYEAALRALSAIAAGKPDQAAKAAILEESDADPLDFTALDAAWEEEAVKFGPGAAASCKDGLIARMRAARRPAQQPA